MECIWIFLVVWKWTFFARFFGFRLEMHVRCDNQYKTGADRGNWDSRGCLSAWVYLRFYPCAWKWNEGLPCLCADCKILISPMLFKFSHSILDWTASSWNFLGIFWNIFRGVCEPCHLWGLYSELALFLFTVVWPVHGFLNFFHFQFLGLGNHLDWSIWTTV